MSEFDDECGFVGPEVCEERMDEQGRNMNEEERKHFQETDEGR
jgi:hypothetical protein